MTDFKPLIHDGIETGWAVDSEDWDALQAIPAGLPFSYKDVPMWPPNIPTPDTYLRIEYQTVGSCNGHAWTTTSETCYHNASGTVIQLNPRAAYYGIQKLDGLAGRDQGSTVAGGMKYTRDYGICKLEAFDFGRGYRWSQPPTDATHKLQNYRRIQSYEEALAWIRGGLGGIVFGISWGSGMGAKVDRFSPGGGGHAIPVLMESDKYKDGDKPYLKGANSWGTGYGDNGWFHWSPRAVDQMCNHRYTVAIAASDMPAIKPRDWDWKKQGGFI